MQTRGSESAPQITPHWIPYLGDLPIGRRHCYIPDDLVAKPIGLVPQSGIDRRDGAFSDSGRIECDEDEGEGPYIDDSRGCDMRGSAGHPGR